MCFVIVECILFLSNCCLIFSKNTLLPQVILLSYLVLLAELFTIHPSPSKYPKIKLGVYFIFGFNIKDLFGGIFRTFIKYSTSSLE